ncbi:MAG TPA: PEGA domain-containing protein [Bacteroidetes bacterium]|nr:PEGA domain protein [bacterium BMS3Bbin04]HDO65379.1 PEGA domain-containing protein [Bacteroidota bacterium]HEX04504.1 PEGA domain-containing protein [Bacteroidota bacterium]
MRTRLSPGRGERVVQRGHRRTAVFGSLIVFILTTLLVPIAPAIAQSKSGFIALAPIKVNELFIVVDSDDIDELRDEIREGIASIGSLELVDQQLVSQWAESRGLSDNEGCFSLACMVELGTDLNADLVVAISIGGKKRSNMVQYEIRLLDVAQGRVVQREIGSGSEPHTLPADEIGERIIQIVERHLSPKGTIIIETDPPESAVLLNGEPIGFAPVTLERSAGLTDTVSVVRQGYTSRSRVVTLDPDETRTLLMELGIETVYEFREFPPLHLFAIAGQPLDQASSNLDSRLSWGVGESYGFRVDAGTVWRFGLGFVFYKCELDDIEASVKTGAGAIKNPEVIATAVHSSMYYYPGSQAVSPYLGLGIAATERRITQSYISGTEERSTDFEVSLMFTFGIEATVYGPIRFQVELLHSRLLFESDAWSLADDSIEQRALWNVSFKDFTTYTLLRAGVGFTF